MKYLDAMLALLVLCSAGCNCNGDTLCTLLNSSATTSTAGSAAGIWTGSDSTTGLQLTGLINANGQANFIRSDSIQRNFLEQHAVSNTTLQIPLTGYPGRLPDLRWINLFIFFFLHQLRHNES